MNINDDGCGGGGDDDDAADDNNADEKRWWYLKWRKRKWFHAILHLQSKKMSLNSRRFSKREENCKCKSRKCHLLLN